MRILYLNLDSRSDRREQAEAEFKRVGLHVERVAAISGDNRPLAFNQSVLKAMEMCRTRVITSYRPVAVTTMLDGSVSLMSEIGSWHYEYEDLLLFEDDVVFSGSDFTEEFFMAFPLQALTIHLGCNIFGADTTEWQMPTRHNGLFAQLHNAWQSHATWYSAECVEYILNNLKPDVLDGENCIFDEWLRKNVLSHGHSYLMRPMIAYQRPGISNIWGDVHTDYTGAHTKGNEWLLKHT